jgi:hypothetical protein
LFKAQSAKTASTSPTMPPARVSITFARIRFLDSCKKSSLLDYTPWIPGIAPMAPSSTRMKDTVTSATMYKIARPLQRSLQSLSGRQQRGRDNFWGE